MLQLGFQKKDAGRWQAALGAGKESLHMESLLYMHILEVCIFVLGETS